MSHNKPPPGITQLPVVPDLGDPEMIRQLQELLAAAKDGRLRGISFVAAQYENGAIATISGGLGEWPVREAAWYASRWLHRIHRLHDGPEFGEDLPK